MKRFRIFIITKKTLQKAAAIGMLAITVAGVCIAFSKKPAAVVPAFSDISIAPERIINDGIPKEDEPFDYKRVISSLLGFDSDKPESIIEGSSEIFNDIHINPSAASPTPLPSLEPVQTDIPIEKGSKSDLPSHDEIINAGSPEINNATNYKVSLSDAAAAPKETNLEFNDEPEVLIVHTHTTECYIGDEMSGESERTTNEQYNVCAVGDVLSGALESYGIKTVHDKTIHDYPSYQGSYSRALNTITADMSKYPSVKVIIDLHRDAYVYPDGTKLSVAAEIDGNRCAQAMLVLGTDTMGLYHPNWRSNLVLAAKLQSAAEIMYPGLMRPINLRRERFNMHVSKGSLLIEIGSNGNTLSEAKQAAAYLGKAIAAALING